MRKTTTRAKGLAIDEIASIGFQMVCMVLFLPLCSSNFQRTGKLSTYGISDVKSLKLKLNTIFIDTMKMAFYIEIGLNQHLKARRNMQQASGRDVKNVFSNAWRSNRSFEELRGEKFDKPFSSRHLLFNDDESNIHSDESFLAKWDSVNDLDHPLYGDENMEYKRSIEVTNGPNRWEISRSKKLKNLAVKLKSQWKDSDLKLGNSVRLQSVGHKNSQKDGTPNGANVRPWGDYPIDKKLTLKSNSVIRERGGSGAKICSTKYVFNGAASSKAGPS
ncbi:hypothetical protein L6452_02397 [Arctium lappa]|uniref:Uncharacterized protein n=1 Tax=Arctium lappa TaxID=4217 RepID=A0ACB9FKU3_ARCLA|nr:hypothetical protein L6452_02397 [Arctium lappa]